MGYAKTADLHVARSADTIAALGALGTFLVRGVDTSDATESATKGTDYGANLKAIINEVVAGAATAAQGALADTALQTVAVPSSITATGTPSATTFLRGDGTWNVPAGGGAVDSVVGQTGTVTAAQILTALLSASGTAGTVAVASSTAGTWPSRPAAQIVIWAAGTDTAAADPGVLATGDDIVILAEDADLTTIAAANNGSILAATTASFTTADETKLDFVTVTQAVNLDTIETDVGTAVQPGDTIPIADGGTGATTVQGAIAALRVAPVTISAATDLLAAGDDGAENLYTNSGLVTVTLANIATNFECVLTSLGAAGLTVAAGGMAFAGGFTPKLTIAQGEALHVKQTGTSTFRILGGTAA